MLDMFFHICDPDTDLAINACQFQSIDILIPKGGWIVKSVFPAKRWKSTRLYPRPYAFLILSFRNTPRRLIICKECDVWAIQISQVSTIKPFSHRIMVYRN